MSLRELAARLKSLPYARPLSESLLRSNLVTRQALMTGSDFWLQDNRQVKTLNLAGCGRYCRHRLVFDTWQKFVDGGGAVVIRNFQTRLVTFRPVGR
jgi:hypothetical protein